MEFLNRIAKDERVCEIARFILTGAVSTIVTYVVYYVSLYCLPPASAFTIGYVVALVVNYYMTTSFTFKVKATKKNGMGFLISNAINYGLCVIVLSFFVWIGVDKRLAPVPMYAICIPANFILVRFVMKQL